MSTSPILPLAAVSAADPTVGHAAATARPASSFARMLQDGIATVDKRMAEADAQVAAFAVDDTIPPHQVLYAIEQARHGMEMMMQVRSHLTEGLQEIMRMQL